MADLFTQLGLIINAIRLVVDGIKMAEIFLDKKNKGLIEGTALNLLEVYFILYDVAKDGESLLDSVGENPDEIINNLSADDAESTLEKWDKIVRCQGQRLNSLKEKLIDQDVLSVVDPSLKARLEKIISSKFNRIDSLHRIGAVVLFYSVFGTLNKEKQLTDVIRVIYRAQKDGCINILEARGEINQLGESLEDYRLACNQLLDNKEKRTLTKKAREATRYCAQS